MNLTLLFAVISPRIRIRYSTIMEPLHSVLNEFTEKLKLSDIFIGVGSWFNFTIGIFTFHDNNCEKNYQLLCEDNSNKNFKLRVVD